MSHPMKRSRTPIELSNIQSDSLYWFVSRKKPVKPHIQILAKLLSPQAKGEGLSQDEIREIKSVLREYSHEFSFLADIYHNLMT